MKNQFVFFVLRDRKLTAQFEIVQFLDIQNVADVVRCSGLGMLSTRVPMTRL